MRRTALAIAFVGVLGTAGSTFADPLLVTSGMHFQTWDRTWSWQLSGDDFTLSGSGITRTSPIFPCGGGCPPGTVIDLDTVMRGSDMGNFNTAADINGQHYAGFFWDGTLTFDSGTLVATPGRFEQPFTFNAVLTPYATKAFTGTPLFPTQTLVGAGTVRLGVIAVGNMEIDGVTYAFASPTPEPATLLLLGTGLAGVFGARRRGGRRVNHKE